MPTTYITGASAGLGRAIAQVFAQAGHRVGLIARDEAALAEAARETGGAFAVADVADAKALEDAARKLEAVIGPPDIWINDAMATIFSRFEDIEPDEFRRATEVTFLGSVYGMRLALRAMKARGRGHIIQIGSALAYRSIPLQAPYCAAKMALRGAVGSLRCELIHDKSPVRVSMVHMPAMNTPQFDWARRHLAEQPQPVPPIYAPEACARAVLWSARHPGKREVWVGKPTWEAILGNKLIPALMDLYMAKNAFEGQFEKPAAERDTNGNLFNTAQGFHRAEGHFAARQKNKVLWIGTSATEEIVLLGVLALLACLFLAGLARLVFG